jgi:hypothetical protein
MIGRIALLLIVLPAAVLTGCVERRLTITSDPAGALVYFADEEIGRTPLTVDFTWYGDREVILRMEGYQTLQTNWAISPPAYDIPPWDLFSQAFVPWTYRYNVSRHFEMESELLPTPDELIDRATQFQAAHPLDAE